MTTSTWAPRVPHENRKAAYEHLRGAHLNAVYEPSLEDHVAVLDWPHQRIEHYQDRTTPVAGGGLGRTLAVARGPDGRHRPGHGDRRRGHAAAGALRVRQYNAARR